jgi:mRNA interferase RelE/StbE
MKQIAYSKSALRSLRRIPADHSRRICSKIERYAAAPSDMANNVTALKGSSYLRLRVGDWRVIMDDEGTVLHVLKVGPRGGIYE